MKRSLPRALDQNGRMQSVCRSDSGGCERKQAVICRLAHARSYILLLLIAATALAESDRNLPTPAARPRLTEEARRRVEDAAAKTSRVSPPSSTASNAGMVMLPTVHVEASYAHLLRRDPDATPLSQPFTWREGGTITKTEGAHVTTELKFQYVPKHKGFDLLSFSW